MENHYSILECSPSASPEEIKRNYHRLVKEHHPDRGAESSERFLLIDKAYKTLKSGESRKEYDSNLLAKNCQEHSLIYAELKRDQIKLSSNGTSTYPCRCGEIFIIEKVHLEGDECILECSECSNCILIN